jgi:hypothetical protein
VTVFLTSFLFCASSFTQKNAENEKTGREKAAKPLNGALRSRRCECGSGWEKVAQAASAWKARAVMSSTLPVPLMARYFGATVASVRAQEA